MIGDQQESPELLAPPITHTPAARAIVTSPLRHICAHPGSHRQSYEAARCQRWRVCYCVRNLYATIRATMIAKISSAGRDFRIVGIVEWRAAAGPG